MASVNCQTRRVNEVIIVNDGSTDESAIVLEELEKVCPNLIVIERYPARGPAESFNDGVGRTTGDLVVALDADDCLPPNYIGRLSAALDDPSVDFAYCGTRTFGSESSYRASAPFDRDQLMVENYINVSSMFRRWIFDATGGFRKEFDKLGLEDWEFWVDAIGQGAVGQAVDDCWLDYRRHSEGSRNNMPRTRVLRGHLLVWRLHPHLFRTRHLLTWIGRSGLRNVEKIRPNRRFGKRLPGSRRSDRTGMGQTSFHKDR